MCAKMICVTWSSDKLSFKEENERSEKMRLRREKKEQKLLIKAIALASYLNKDFESMPEEI